MCRSAPHGRQEERHIALHRFSCHRKRGIWAYIAFLDTVTTTATTHFGFQHIVHCLLRSYTLVRQTLWRYRNHRRRTRQYFVVVVDVVDCGRDARRPSLRGGGRVERNARDGVGAPLGGGVAGRVTLASWVGPTVFA